MQTEISHPIINTYLTSTVRLLPTEMDNNFKKYIKNTLINEHENRCFKDYGYIEKIHECNINMDAYITPEDPLCCPIFKVNFLCSLCRPINNTIIIGKIQGLTPPLIKVVSGSSATEHNPINIIVKQTNVNKNIFMFNNKINSWVVKMEKDNKFIMLKDGMYVKVKILSKKIVDRSNKILCMGFIESLAEEDEIKKSIKDNYAIHTYSDINKIIEDENTAINKMREDIAKLAIVKN
jgi:DNA-directed RNA polymerase subunit E'/Rpb7